MMTDGMRYWLTEAEIFFGAFASWGVESITPSDDSLRASSEAGRTESGGPLRLTRTIRAEIHHMTLMSVELECRKVLSSLSCHRGHCLSYHCPALLSRLVMTTVRLSPTLTVVTVTN